MKTNAAEKLDAAEEIKKKFEQLVLNVEINDSGEARVAATMLLTVLEQFGAVIHLSRAEYSSHSPIIVRSMLEGLANLINLCKDANYLDQLRFDNARNNAITFAEYANDTSMQDDPKAIALLNDWRNKEIPIRDKLSAKGLKKQDVIEKFRLAGIQSTYVAYRVFCSFAHNQLTTLMARHVDKLELSYLRDAPAELKQSILNIALSIVSQSINMLPNFSNVDAATVKQTIDEADALWNSLSGN